MKRILTSGIWLWGLASARSSAISLRLSPRWKNQGSNPCSMERHSRVGIAIPISGVWKMVRSSVNKLDHQPPQNIFCIWKGGQPGDFDLKAQYKITGVNDGNSGFQYRSIERRTSPSG